jgi:hypothetical protein
MPDAKRLRQKFSYVSTLAELEAIAEENILNKENETSQEREIPVLVAS